MDNIFISQTSPDLKNINQASQGLIQDLNLGAHMNISSWTVKKRQKILQADRSFVFCFMFSLGKYAFFKELFLGTTFIEYRLYNKNYANFNWNLHF